MENVEDKIKSIIDELKPFLISDGGALEYIKFEDGIEQMIMNEVPEVKEVRNVN